MDGRSYEIYYSGDSLNQSDLNVWLRIAALYSYGHIKISENVWLYLHEFLSRIYQSSVPPHPYFDLEETIKKLYGAEIVLVRAGKPLFYADLFQAVPQYFWRMVTKKLSNYLSIQQLEKR